MISFVRLIDGTILLGKLNEDSEEFIIMEDAMILGCSYEETIEQRYFFKGMYCPFVDDTKVQSIIDKINVISMHGGLDSYLISQYNNYLDQWYKSRSRYKKSKEYMTDSLEEEIEELILAMKQSQQANNIH